MYYNYQHKRGLIDMKKTDLDGKVTFEYHQFNKKKQKAELWGVKVDPSDASLSAYQKVDFVDTSDDLAKITESYLTDVFLKNKRSKYFSVDTTEDDDQAIVDDDAPVEAGCTREYLKLSVNRVSWRGAVVSVQNTYARAAKRDTYLKGGRAPTDDGAKQSQSAAFLRLVRESMESSGCEDVLCVDCPLLKAHDFYRSCGVPADNLHLLSREELCPPARVGGLHRAELHHHLAAAKPVPMHLDADVCDNLDYAAELLQTLYQHDRLFHHQVIRITFSIRNVQGEAAFPKTSGISMAYATERLQHQVAPGYALEVAPGTAFYQNEEGTRLGFFLARVAEV